MINKKRKAISPQAGTCTGETASQNQVTDNSTIEFALQPNYLMINRYFEILTSSKDAAVTIQYFDDVDKKNAANAGFKHLKRSATYDFLRKQQEKNCGIYVMVNQGDGEGRKKENVVKVRALFVDLDGSPWEPPAKALKPHMRVESSPGRWHLFWLIDDCTLEQFKPLQQAIAAKFNGDKSCCDLSRVLRVPGFYHLKKEPVMTRLVEAHEFPRYTTQEIIDKLGLNLTASSKAARNPEADLSPVPSPAYTYTDPNTGDMIDLAKWAAQNPDFDIVGSLNSRYSMGRVSEGKIPIVCPFAGEHTDPTPDLATFVANLDKEHPTFAIHCLHQHCVDRDRLEFLQVFFEKGYLPASILIPEPLELLAPKWIKFQVRELESSPDWVLLAPHERRIAWDLQFLAWKTDGTIDDDDWKISKFLGLAEDEWLIYRNTLIKAGWLKKFESRLTNGIVKREFDLARISFSERSAAGKKGGLATQQKYKEQRKHV